MAYTGRRSGHARRPRFAHPAHTGARRSLRHGPQPEPAGIHKTDPAKRKRPASIRYFDTQGKLLKNDVSAMPFGPGGAA